MQLLNKILWEGKSKWQLLSAAIGVFLGLLLLLAAIQIYQDVQQILSGDGNKNKQFVQINKKVNFLNMLGMKPNFSEEEIKSIDSLDFVNAVGTFTPSQYKVTATLPSLGFRTDMFFEAVPDEFLDVDIEKFSWEKGQKEIPVVISRDYLALYNFGFAPSQGLPALTPATIERFSVTVNITGKGLQQSFEGRIVGMSDRINSILVPMSFMKWANVVFGSKQNFNASRLILQVENPLSEELQLFLSENDYEVSQGKLIGGQFGVLLNILVAVIAVIGLVIVLLAVLVFSLNFQLIVAESREDVRLLLQLGYREAQLSQILFKKMTLIFTGILLMVFIALFICRFFFLDYFNGEGFELVGGFHWTVYLSAMAFALVFAGFNRWNLQKEFNAAR